MANAKRVKKDIEVTAEPTKEESMSTQLVVRPEPVRALMRGDEMALAITEYKELQNTLDKSMPDQIMEIQGKQFRKKNYWRALRTAFGLSVECRTPEDQERVVTDDDWGYRVTYRATSPTGNFADGDGCCMASEKSKGRMTATEHNVRSHAHTRGFNRAVSNLVGFGEVSAGEIEDSDRVQPAQGWEGRDAGRLAPKSDGLKFGNGKQDAQGLSHAKQELKDIVENHIKDYEPELKPEQIYVALTKYDSYVKKDSKGEPVMVKDAKTGKMIPQMVPANPGQASIDLISDKAAGVAVGRYRKMMEAEKARRAKQ